MTDKEILQAEGEELDRLAGEILEAEHVIDNGFCENCLRLESDCDEPCDTINTSDWNEAMKWRDWCVKKYGDDKYFECLIGAMMDKDYSGRYTVWICGHAQPDDYFKAILLCVADKEQDND